MFAGSAAPFGKLLANLANETQFRARRWQLVLPPGALLGASLGAYLL